MRTLDLMLVSLLVLLHLTIHVGFGVGAAAPDLFTLAVLILARQSHMALAAGIGLALGLLEDAQGLLAFGANALALSVTGALGARTRDFFVGDSLLFVGSYLFLGKWARDVLHWIALGSENREGVVQSLVVESVPAALYVTVVGLALALATGVLRDRGGVR